MRLSIIPKNELSATQLGEAATRIFAPENVADVGPRYMWNRPEYDHGHLALFDAETGDFVGTVYCVLIPPVAQDFTWWLDAPMRKKGYWRALADDLARFLRKRHRIEKIGLIVFGKQHRPASLKIAERLRENFEKKAPVGQAGRGGAGK